MVKNIINHETETITSKKIESIQSEPIVIEEPKIVSENTKKDSVPLLTIEQYVELNKNQRQELERQCIGSSSPTCRLSSSTTFIKVMESRKSFCEMNNSYNTIVGGGRKNCNDL